MTKKKKFVFVEKDAKYNPLKDFKTTKLEGWDIGPIRISMSKKDNKIRNIVCEGLEIKHLVFGKNPKKKKSS